MESSQPIAAAGIFERCRSCCSPVRQKARRFCWLDSFASQKSGSRVYRRGQEVVCPGFPAANGASK